MLCGFAWSLQFLLLFRILQGLGGGGMVPVAQSLLADSFPPEKRAKASHCLALRWWWRRWSGRHWAAG
jgi:MFS family permease